MEVGDTYFESLRATTAKQRLHATAFAEQLWEISHALETYVRFPDVRLPETPLGSSGPERAQRAAQAVRAAWGLGVEPMGHLVSHIESNGIVAALAPRTEQTKARIDAYSTLTFGRPLMVLTPDRADDVFRHRFSAAHELGHLVLHNGELTGDVWLEKEADAFAAEFLTPSAVMAGVLPRRLNFAQLTELSERWGVSVKMLVFRSQELGLISESTARRAYIRLAQNPVQHRPIRLYEGEVPSMLKAAFDLAETGGLTQVGLAKQLGWKPRRVRQILGDDDSRPRLVVIR
ncbi:ImmA/IrrE family metallo-endopeptidase [Nocardioides alcanivorans]|uniref:ImmA/IrrE family metallo-endopeptidase n=1 Tax=Nocardioides alcanivorans TaxID=2897352 RepID=UPI001F44B992|nr:ImmA/IrrE family metallo-endopeptidase [Nocardioides alcanivorans]